MGWDTLIHVGLSPISPLNEFLEDAPTQVLADLLNVGLEEHKAQCWVPSATQVTRSPQVPSLCVVFSTPGISHIPTATLPLPGPWGCFRYPGSPESLGTLMSPPLGTPLSPQVTSTSML